MSQPIRLELPPRDARAELQTRLQDAPLQHAEALLSGYDLLQRLHDRGVLDLLRGGLGSSDKVLSIAVDAAKTPEAINATRNLLILSKVGFIGLGIMGSRMAANLQKHGHFLVVFNRTREKAEALVAEGAAWADSPAALALQVEVIFTMLAHPDAVEEAALGDDGFLRYPQPGQMWIDCSTVNPSFSRKMAAEAKAQGVGFLGAPVTGSKGQADLAELAFWVGGETSDLETCRPLLECMGNRIIHCGGPGTGAFLKMVMNQLLGTAMAAFSEGLVLGESLCLSSDIFFESLLCGPTPAPFLAFKPSRVESGTYQPACFPLR